MSSDTIGLVTAEEGTTGYPFIDYDGVSLASVLRDVKALQRQFSLGTATVMKTDHGFHAHFFHDNALEWGAVRRIIEASRYCDPQFKSFKDLYAFSRVRVKGKFKFVKRVYGFKPRNGYGDFLEWMYLRVVDVR